MFNKLLDSNDGTFSLLTADDIKRLRASGFPDPAQPPARLDWGPWKVAWPKSYVENIEKVISQPGTQQPGNQDLHF